MTPLNQLSILVTFLGNEIQRANFLRMVENYTSKDIQCVFVDAMAVAIQEKINPRIKYIHAPNTSIYQAFNKGLREIESSYYVVCGADDTLLIENIKAALSDCSSENPDIIVGNVRSPGGGLLPTKKRGFPYSHLRHIRQHSVGTIIKTSIHLKIGYYNEVLRIASDAEFILKAAREGCSFKIVKLDFGIYGGQGISYSQMNKSMREMAKVSISHKKYLSCMFYLAKSII